MKKEYKLTFYKSELVQLQNILENREINDKICYFLLRYIAIEAFYKKLLVASKEENKTMTEKEKNNLCVKVSDVLCVLKYFEIECDKNLIERIFGSNDKNYMECSIKKLRDRLVHKSNENVIRTILERYETINEDIDSFLELFN